jgi:cell division protease FtsH
VKRLLEEGYSRAVEILKKYRKKLDLIANELIKKETIEGDEFEQLMGGPRKVALAFA